MIGASAGGVDALLSLLPALPPGYAPAVVCMLHVPGDRESRLAEVFAARVTLPVREARDKAPIEPGIVYFAGSGYHLSIEEDRSFSLSCEAPVHFARPSIDILMESAADVYGPALAGILLTGANYDGADGHGSIREHGGLTIVQDPEEAQRQYDAESSHPALRTRPGPAAGCDPRRCCPCWRPHERPCNYSKILIVDDSAREPAGARGADPRTTSASSTRPVPATHALALLLEHEFALAILDVQMPGMDGFELAELMRGTERTRHIPIVFVRRPGASSNYAFKGYETGAVDFLYKPLDPDAVRSKVTRVRRARTSSAARRGARCEALERSRQEQETLLRELNQTQQELQRSLRCATNSCRWSRTNCARRSTRCSSRPRCAACSSSAAMWRPSRRSRWKRWSQRDERQIKSHDPPDRRHAGRLAHAQRQAVDPADAGAS